MNMEYEFIDRVDAGKRLADELAGRVSADAVVLAVPRGGVPVGVEIALRLELALDLIVVRKLPIPWNPEAGFGAITSDAAVVLNEDLVREVGITSGVVDSMADGVSAWMAKTEQSLREHVPKQDLSGREVVLVDDGLASGYTMLAAVRSARQADAGRLVVAVPVASESAARMVKPAADEFVCLIESRRLPFAVADYYVSWHDLSESQVIDHLNLIPR